MNIARSFSSKRKENVIRASVMSRTVSMFCVAGNLSSLRMSSLVRCTRGSKDKIDEERFVGSIEKGHENVRAFAGGNEQWTGAIWRLACTGPKSSDLFFGCIDVCPLRESCMCSF